jgi:hypothetical protein
MKLVPKLASIDDLLAGRCGEVAPGDVFAFNGISTVDAFIQDATDSAISHVGIVIRETDRGPLSLLEATGKGITATPLAEVLEGYRPDHTCFYLPLAPASRALVVPALLTDYYLSNALDKYNYDGVVEAGLYDLDHPFFERLLTHFHQNSPVARVARWWEKLVNEGHKIWLEIFGESPAYRRLFCSQLVSEVLQAMKVVNVPPLARLVVPIEVCWFDIYAGAYQLNGEFLMLDPFRWGDAPAALAEAVQAALPQSTPAALPRP